MSNLSAVLLRRRCGVMLLTGLLVLLGHAAPVHAQFNSDLNFKKAVKLLKAKGKLFRNNPRRIRPGQYAKLAISGDIDTRSLEEGLETLSFNLPDGNIATFTASSIKRRGKKRVAWHGHGENDRADVASLTLKNNLIFGRFTVGDQVYEVRSRRNGKMRIEELDRAIMPSCATDSHIHGFDGTVVGGIGNDTGGTSGGGTPAAVSDEEVVMDLLAVYSNDARDGAGGTAEIEALIQAAVDSSNSAFINSNMTARFRLVHVAHVDYDTGGDTSADLSWVRTSSEVAALRNQYGADMVSILVDTPGSCGTGYVQRSPGAGFAPYAFQATDIDCAVGNLTFAHEHGHNMGFEHNIENSSATTSSASYPWSFGRFVNGNYRTVMSYSSPCTNGCSRVSHFSNPDISYNGVPTGIADESDNARTGDLTAPIISNFRATVVPPEGTVVVGVIGEYGDASINTQNVANLVDSWSVDSVISTGGDRADALIDYDQSTGQFYCDYLADAQPGAFCSGSQVANNAFFPAPGSFAHNNGNGIVDFENYFTLPGSGQTSSNSSSSELYYDVERGPIHFFILDSQSALADSNEMQTQRNWLQQQLAASDATWKIVVLSNAPYTSGDAIGSNVSLRWPFAAWGAHAVIAGQERLYERLDADLIPYFVNGAGGAPLDGFTSVLANSQVRYNAAHGAMRITATAEQVSFEFFSHTGALIDSHTVAASSSGQSLQLRIASGNDDVEQEVGNGFMYFNSSDLELTEDFGYAGDNQVVGLRFQNVDIPIGSVIEDAWLEFTVEESNSSSTSLEIRAELSGNASSFSSSAFDLTSRPQTSAVTYWSNLPAWNVVGAKVQSPSITSQVQDVVGQAAWAGGNSMVFLISGSGQRQAESYEGSAANAVLLHVEYSSPASALGIHEAEFASLSGTIAENVYTGYSASGYVEFINARGDSIEWSVDAEQAGNVGVNFRYALQNSDTPLQLLVNNVSVATLDFASTGSWTNWQHSNPLFVTLNQGINSIRLEAAGSIGPNIDYLRISESLNQPPVAGFSSAVSDLSVNFTDTSIDSDGSIASWAWDFGDGNVSNSQNPTHSYATAGTWAVTLTVTDNEGSSSSVTNNVTVTAPNVPPVAIISHVINDLTVTVFDSSTDSDGFIASQSWDFGDGYVSAGAIAQRTYAASGTYTITLVTVDDDGASDTASITVTVAAPNVAPTASFTSSVSDLTASFTDTSSDSDGTIVSHSWNFGDSNSSSQANPSHTYAIAGSYTVTLTVTDDDGASNSASATVTVTAPNVAPTASFTTAVTDLTASFTDASSDLDGSIANHSWDFGDGNGSSQANPSYTYATAGSYTVTLTVTDDDGASNTAAATVTVTAPNVAPSASFTSSVSDLTASFADTSSDSDGTIVSHSWNFGDGNSSSQANPSHTYAVAGSYTVSLTVTDDDGASNTTSATVTVTAPNVAPAASFTSTVTDLTADFTDTSSDSDGSIASHSWDFGDGNGSSQANPSHTYATAGSYTVTLTVTDDDGASNTASATVTVTVTAPNVAPVASFTSTVYDLTASFTDTSSDSDGSIASYSWDFGDGNGSSQANPSHTYAAAGSYTVFLTVTDDDGASNTASATVTVTAPNVAPAASFTSTVTGLTANFTDTSSDSDGSIASHSWDFGDGNGSSLQNPAHTYAVAGTYTVMLTVIDNEGASNSALSSVTVTAPNVAPTANFSSSVTDLSASFTDASTDADGTVVSFSWDFGDGNGSNQQNPVHVFAASGNYVVTLTVTDDDGASNSISASITATAPNVPPVASFTTSITDLAVRFADTSADSDGSIVGWSWQFGDGNSSSSQNPLHSYAAAGSYTVTLMVTDDDGAVAEVNATISVEAPVSASVKFDVGVAANLDSAGWTTITLPNTYDEMVVVATAVYDRSGLPAIVRIQSAAGNSFQARVQNPSGSSLTGITMHYLVVEAGVYNQQDHGITMEAVRFNSMITDRKSNWNGTVQSYDNTYSNPVVIGQVMSYSDSNWSVFWSRGSSRRDPASSSSLRVGKHVGEDTNLVRNDEIVGYVVIESGSGTLGEMNYVAGVGTDIVRGMDNSPAYSYVVPVAGTSVAAIVNLAGMDGNDGGWAVLYPPTPISFGTLNMAVDEDQVSNSERRHTTEQVSYLIFSSDP